MKTKITIFLFFLFLSLNAQVSNLQIGLITGNNIALTDIGERDFIDNKALLRYSAGILLRHKFKAEKCPILLVL